jgi:hypothetical protein
MPYISSVTQAGGYTLEVVATSNVTTSLTWFYIRKDRVSEVETLTQAGNLPLTSKTIATNVARIVLIAATQGGSALIRINGGVFQEVGANPDATIVFDVT